MSFLFSCYLVILSKKIKLDNLSNTHTTKNLENENLQKQFDIQFVA